MRRLEQRNFPREGYAIKKMKIGEQYLSVSLFGTVFLLRFGEAIVILGEFFNVGFAGLVDELLVQPIVQQQKMYK